MGRLETAMLLLSYKVEIRGDVQVMWAHVLHSLICCALNAPGKPEAACAVIAKTGLINATVLMHGA